MVEPAQYTSLAFGRRCEEAGTSYSAGRAGACYDNAVNESFFTLLEAGLTDRTRFVTRVDTEWEMFSCIEGLYNPWRRNPANGQLSPAEYERRHSRATQGKLGELSRAA